MIYSYIPESRAGHDAFDPWAVTREPYPFPVYTSRESQALPFPCPTAVLSLEKFARAWLWDVRMQYSRGQVPHATTSRPGVVKDLIALRFARLKTRRQAYAVYSRNMVGGSWVWSSVMIWGPDLPPYPDCSITELHEYLEMAPDWSQERLEGWVRELRTQKAAKASTAKERVRARGSVSREREGMR